MSLASKDPKAYNFPLGAYPDRPLIVKLPSTPSRKDFFPQQPPWYTTLLKCSFRCANLPLAFFHVCGTGLLLITLFCFLDPVFWAADLFANLRPHYCFIAILLLIPTLLFRHFVWAGIAGLSLLLNTGAIAVCLIPDPAHQTPTSGPVLKVLVLNVLTQNRDSRHVLEYIRSVDPDVLALIEVDDFWHHELQTLQSTWPCLIAENRPDNFGIRLMSKHPFVHQEFFRNSRTNLPSILVRLEEPSPLTLVATHPLPPVNPRQSAMRDNHLDEVAARINLETQPVILLADLNATPWTHGYRRFARASGLSGFISERGIRPTHQTGIPIDYVMAKGLVLRNFMIGPEVGSDHLGVSAEVLLPKPLSLESAMPSE